MSRALTWPAHGGRPSSPDLRTQLHAATADVHARLDARFAAGLGAPGAYPVYLLGMARLLAAFEQMGRPWREDPEWSDWVRPGRAGLLQADLAAVGLAPLAEAAGVACPDAGGLLGALYVIEGSAMGARLLRRQLPVGAPAAFLESHAGAARWPALQARLEAASGDPAIAATACTHALGLFALADESFRLAAGEAPHR